MPKLCVPPGEKHCSYERMGARLASKFETVPCSELILTVWRNPQEFLESCCQSQTVVRTREPQLGEEAYFLHHAPDKTVSPQWILWNTNPFQEMCFLWSIGHLLHVLIKWGDFCQCSFFPSCMEVVRAYLLTVRGAHVQWNVFVLMEVIWHRIETEKRFNYHPFLPPHSNLCPTLLSAVPLSYNLNFSWHLQHHEYNPMSFWSDLHTVLMEDENYARSYITKAQIMVLQF